MSDINTDEIVKALRAATIAFEAHTRAQDTATRSHQDAATAVDALSQAHDQAAAESEASSKKTTEALKTLGKAIGSSAVDFTKAMVTGGEGTAKYAGAVTGAADAVGGFAASFGPLGMAAGLLVKAFGALVGASLKQNDQLMKSYRELSDIGSVSGSLEQLRSDLGKVGLTSTEAENFGSMLKKVAPELAGFGGSVSEGKKKLIDVIQGLIGDNNPIEQAMSRIGYSAESMRDTTASYIQQQTVMGLAQTKTTKQLQAESVTYMTSLRELGELTGASRDQLMKVQEDQLRDVRYATALREMSDSGNKDGAAAMLKFTTQLELINGKKLTAGVIDTFINLGPVTEEGIDAFLATQGEAGKQISLITGNLTTTNEAVRQINNGLDRQNAVLGKSSNMMGKTLDRYVGDFDARRGANMIRGKQDIAMDSILEEQKKKKGDQLDKATSLEQKARRDRIIADELLLSIGNKAVGMFESLVDIMHKFAKFLAQTIDKISPYIPGMSSTHLADKFKDKEDFQTDLKIAYDAKAAAEKQTRWLQQKNDEIAADKTGASVNKDIIALKETISKTRVHWEKEAGTGNIITNKGDPVAHAAAVEQLAILEEIKRNVVRRGGPDLEKLNTIKEAELLKLKEKTAKSEADIIAAKTSLGKFTAESPTATAEKAASTAGAPKAAPGGAGKRGGAAAPDPDKVLAFTGNSGSKKNYEGLDPELQKRLLAAGEAYAAATGGSKLQINSAKRDATDQQRLWDETEALGTPGFGPEGRVVARPGTSPHEKGRAVDIQNYMDPAAIKAMNDQGLFQNVKGDEVHFELPQARNGGAFTGPTSGYPVELHGKNESVWPEKKLKAVLAEVQKSSIEDYKKEILADMGLNKSAAPIPAASPTNSDGIAQMMDMMTSKFDSMIAQLDNSNSTLSELLTYTRA